MNGNIQLHKAVELAMAAGYQLDREAFEFLTLLATTEDPTGIVTKAIAHIGGLTPKPLLIERRVLEEILKPVGIVGEDNTQEQTLQPRPEQQGREKEPSEAKTSFVPFAREVDAALSIIDDPGAKESGDGTYEAFLGYFQDRFKRLERLLRQRMDVKSATSILDAIRAQPNTRLKIICMVTEKRESKQRMILSVEDLKSNATVLVPQNASQDLQKKAKMLFLDQVICLSIVKTRSNLLVAEDIILPELAQRTQHKASAPVYAVLTSDMHVGSAKFTRQAFDRFILWLNGKYGTPGMKEIASRVKYVLIAGDIVDGVGVYPNQIRELAVKDVHKQYKLAARYFEQIPEYIEVAIIPGNHDASRKALPQPPIVDAFPETLKDLPNIHLLGSPCTISIHGVEVLMFHGRSLDDVISTVPGMSHPHPERSMRLLLQSRHLTPIYGGKTPISPDTRDALVIERIPDILHAGHVHSLEYGNYRGVLIVNSGCWQEQTEYMLRNGFTPTPAIVPVVNLQTLEVSTLSFA